VGGNLGLGVCQYLDNSDGKGREVKAWLGFCPLVDFRLKPQEKLKPPNFPTSDPLRFLVPLYDTYAGTPRSQHLEDPRLHPILAKKSTLPMNMLFIVAGIDILLHEQLTMIERLKTEFENEGERNEHNVEAMLVEKGFHGFLECK
jgi:acetyl esterase/lipase